MTRKVFNQVLTFFAFSLCANIVFAADCDFKDEKKISLVDVTFCSNNLVTQLTKDKLDEYRDEYKKYFGDITIERTDTDTTSSWKPEKVAPTGSTISHCQTPGQLAITTLTCELATAKWTALMEVLAKICEGPGNEKPEKLIDASEKYFKDQEELAEKYNNMSIPEVKFTEYSAQSFLKLYRSFTQDLSCEEFTSPVEYSELWELYGTEDGALTDEQRKRFNYTNYYFNFVTNVAYHHALSVMLNYAGLVNTAVSTFNDEQRKIFQALLSGLNESSGNKLGDLQATQLNIAKGLVEMHGAIEERLKNYKIK